jgi:predicted ATP-grasp superfamily ATP-dependent carboligase
LPVLSFPSRPARARVEFPSYATNPSAFAGAVVDFVRQHGARVVLPASDGAIAALAGRRACLAALRSVLALPGDEAMAVANDKGRTMAVAATLGIDSPRTLPVATSGELSRAIAELGLPLVLKPARSWAPHSAIRLQATDVLTEAEAAAAHRRYLTGGTTGLAQEWVGGRREGVTLFRVDGATKAAFAHIEHRTTPALGGASVVRESVAVPADIGAAADRLVAALGLDGLCEVEFRRDAAGRPLLMEINARLAGPTEIALRCGVDFPLMLWRWAVGLPVEVVSTYRTGMRMRWLRGDMRWLRDNMRRAGRPDSLTRTRALADFAAEFLRTDHYDCLYHDDLRPAWAELRTTVAALRRERPQQSVTSNAFGKAEGPWPANRY